jgi:hypothetical protein
MTLPEAIAPNAPRHEGFLARSEGLTGPAGDVALPRPQLPAAVKSPARHGGVILVASTGTTASTSGRSVNDPSHTSCVPLRPSRWLDRASVLLIVNPAHPDSMRVQALPTLMGVSEDDSFSVVLECPLCGVNLKQSTGRYWPDWDDRYRQHAPPGANP